MRRAPAPRSKHRRSFALLIAAGLMPPVGCTEFPALNTAVDPAVTLMPFPKLVPIDPLLQAAQIPGTAPDTLQAQADALRARADALRSAP